MKIVTTLTVLLCLILTACGEDESCTRADWAGTYVLQDKDCLDESIEFEDLIVIEEGSGENTIIIDGEEITVTACEATALGLFELKLEGDKLKIGLIVGGCEGEYKRN
ncbi:MAG: hypothetical protein HKN68_01955 [Saprospiraceae bacterium]|nr:hypothetical protein [Saprospiraceae bacterium]